MNIEKQINLTLKQIRKELYSSEISLEYLELDLMNLSPNLKGNVSLKDSLLTQIYQAI